MPTPPSGDPAECGPLGPLTARHLTRRFLPPALFLSALIWAMLCSPAHRRGAAQSAQGGAVLSTFNGVTMGTTYQVKIVGPALDPAQREALSAAIQATLDRVVTQMSTYEAESELSRFNQHQQRTPVVLSEALFGVISEAQRISAASGGAFDVTVGPLVNAWGFGPDGRQIPPSAAQLEQLRAYVGWQKLSLAPKARTASKAHPKLYVDLSAIAKGYGVDQVAQSLEGLGHHDYLVEVGGELRARGHNPSGAPWRVGIERPTSGQRAVQEVVALKNTAMATSGDYRNFYERDGVRLSHTIDPRVGAPIKHRLASVTVLHPSCATADAWATALNVLGPEEGLAVAKREGLAAYFLVREADGQLSSERTEAFEAHRSP